MQEQRFTIGVRVPNGGGGQQPPQPPPQAPGNSYNDLLASAQTALSRRQPQQAIQLLQQATSADAERPEAYAMMGFAYIYGLGDLNSGGRAYRKAYDLGGEITFYLKHDLLDGMFTQYRTGTLHISRSRISFRGDDGVNVFSAPRSAISEAKKNSGAFGILRQVRARSPFHIKIGREKKDNFNLAPTTSSPDQERDLILSFIGKD